MPDGLGASTRVTRGSRSAVRGISPKAGRAQVARGSGGASTPWNLATREERGRAGEDLAASLPLMRRTLTLCRTALAGAALAVLLTACGGGGNDTSTSSSSSTTTSSSSSSSSSAAAANTEFCQQASTLD